jgi:2-phosphosulfolactate phosphatase
VQPYGFDLQNSPTEIVALPESGRPIILLSTSGTRLVTEASASNETYLACLRNATAQARHLAASGRDALILGADSRGEFREEDQLCAARIGAALVRAGYEVADGVTEAVIDRWAYARDDAFIDGRSARYLRETEQHQDLAFVLEHVDDLDQVFGLESGCVRAVGGA